MSVLIHSERCPQNHKCPAIRACPVEALVQKGTEAPTVDAQKSIECGKCAQVCPRGALQRDGQPK